MDLTPDLIRSVVASSDKQRFALSPDGTRIRANHEHSVAVDLGLAPVVPPDQLYHGTATRFLDLILRQGLTPQARQHVHLSADMDTATTVGARHGRPVILKIPARSLHDRGTAFFQSDNGVWLTGAIAPDDLSVLDPS